MITIEKLEKKVESFTDKLRVLSYPFLDKSLETEAERAKEDAITALEAYLDLAQTDSETGKEEGEDESSEED